MDDERHFRQTLVLGITIAALGLICLGGGVALLGWRLLKPDKAILLPPGAVNTPERTPTLGVLGTPLAPPPMPDDPVQLVMLPVSDPPTSTPTGPVPSATTTPSVTPSVTHTPTASLTVTTSPIPIPSLVPDTAVPTRNPVVRSSPTVSPTSTTAPTGTPTPSDTPTPTHIASPTPAPTLTPSPTLLPAIPDRILIDAIGLDAPVVPVGQHSVRLGNQVYSQWNVPDTFAAGWHQNSAPLGQPGNSVLNGHHNVNGEVFRYLINLEPGDTITLESQGKRYRYIVAQTMTLREQDQPVEVRRENARWILPTTDERVTLVTCWPHEASTHRLVVIALPDWRLRPPDALP